MSVDSDILVSIIIPVYNGGNYLQEAIDSALQQTYPRIEIVLVNDGSNDDGLTESLCRQNVTRRPDRIRYLWQENRGVAGALNTGIEAMKGDVFCWLSHDDLYLPDKVERQVQLLLASGRRDAIIFSDWEYIGPSGEALYPVTLNANELGMSGLGSVLSGAVNGCTVMIPAALFKEGHVFDERYRYVQDYRLWYSLARRVPFLRCPDILVRQRLHPDQDSSKMADRALAEGEDLWHDMVFGTSKYERIHLCGSEERFFSFMCSRLAQMPYKKTASAVVSYVHQVKSARIRVLSVTYRDNALAYALNEFDENDSVHARSVDSVGPIEAVMRSHDVDYVVFASSSQVWPSGILCDVARRMSADGEQIYLMEQPSLTANGFAEVDRSLSAIRSDLQPFMVHRIVVASGQLDCSSMLSVKASLSRAIEQSKARKRLVKIGVEFAA